MSPQERAERIVKPVSHRWQGWGNPDAAPRTEAARIVRVQRLADALQEVEDLLERLGWD